MREIKVDIEKWIYERNIAYPMIKTVDCDVGESSLGRYFRYEPTVKIEGVYVPIKDDNKGEKLELNGYNLRNLDLSNSDLRYSSLKRL